MALRQEPQTAQKIQDRPDSYDVHANLSVGVDQGRGWVGDGAVRSQESGSGKWRAILPLLWIGRGSAQGLH